MPSQGDEKKLLEIGREDRKMTFSLAAVTLVTTLVIFPYSDNYPQRADVDHVAPRTRQ